LINLTKQTNNEFKQLLINQKGFGFGDLKKLRPNKHQKSRLLAIIRL